MEAFIGASQEMAKAQVQRLLASLVSKYKY
jgi:hypothetical protein